jgi:hypothetical protein
VLALELHAMEPAALAARFSHSVLAGIRASVPLEAGTAGRLAQALAVLKATPPE